MPPFRTSPLGLRGPSPRSTLLAKLRRASRGRNIGVRHRSLSVFVTVDELGVFRLVDVRTIELKDLSHVTLSLRVGRDSAVRADSLIPGVIGSQGQRKTALIAVQESAKMTNASIDVLAWDKGVPDPE